MAVQKQVSVALPADVRDRLEAAATTAGHSIAEEIRRRLERGFEDDDVAAERTDITRLMEQIGAMACLAELVTGNRWSTDAASAGLVLLGLAKFVQRAVEGGDLWDVVGTIVEHISGEVDAVPLATEFHRGIVKSIKCPKESWGEHWQEAPEAIADILTSLIARLNQKGELRMLIASHAQTGRKLKAGLIKQMQEGEGKDGE
jgi:hypothetical protein